MKKLLIFLIFLSFVLINALDFAKAENCQSIITPDDLNSKNIINYLKEKNIDNKITRICSDFICENINASILDRSVDNFITKNYNFLKAKGDEILLNAKLKGFKINKIYLNSCY